MTLLLTICPPQLPVPVQHKLLSQTQPLAAVGASCGASGSMHDVGNSNLNFDTDNKKRQAPSCSNAVSQYAIGVESCANYNYLY